MQEENAKADQSKKKKNQPNNIKDFNQIFSYSKSLIHAEVSIYPMGTSSTSASFYIAKGIEAIQDIEDIKYEINPMGTIIESNSLSKIFEATEKMSEAVHNLNVGRVEIILKIDSRRDKNVSMQEKLDSVKEYLKS